jgi:hypothetical protein
MTTTAAATARTIMTTTDATTAATRSSYRYSSGSRTCCVPTEMTKARHDRRPAALFAHLRHKHATQRSRRFALRCAFVACSEAIDRHPGNCVYIYPMSTSTMLRTARGVN